MGRPAGSENKDKPFRDALRMEIRAAENSPRALRQIANKLIDMAASGDMQAIKEIGDRLDGKPAQESTLTVRNELDSMNDSELRELIRREIEGSGGNSTSPAKSSDTRVTH